MYNVVLFHIFMYEYVQIYLILTQAYAHSELEVMLRVIESICGHSMHRMWRRWCVQAMMRMWFCSREFAIAVLFRWSDQKNWSQRQRLAGTSNTLSFVDIAWIHFSWDMKKKVNCMNISKRISLVLITFVQRSIIERLWLESHMSRC